MQRLRRLRRLRLLYLAGVLPQLLNIRSFSNGRPMGLFLYRSLTNRERQRRSG